jgi:quercetin dioxygenase-like cupin family protein
MNVTRFAQAPVYAPPHHFDMRCLRLQGHEAGETRQLWMGISEIAPGGHTTLDGSAMEKHYVVLEGELTLVSELHGVRQESVLRPLDSCCFEPGEKRQIVNRSQAPARILLAMPLLPASAPA